MPVESEEVVVLLWLRVLGELEQFVGFGTLGFATKATDRMGLIGALPFNLIHKDSAQTLNMFPRI